MKSPSIEYLISLSDNVDSKIIVLVESIRRTIENRNNKAIKLKKVGSNLVIYIDNNSLLSIDSKGKIKVVANQKLLKQVIGDININN